MKSWPQRTIFEMQYLCKILWYFAILQFIKATPEGESFGTTNSTWALSSYCLTYTQQIGVSWGLEIARNCQHPNQSLKSPSLPTFRARSQASLVAQTVKRLSTMRETGVRSLGWEDPLEKEMAIHSSTIAWEISWTEEPGRLQSRGRKELDTTERLHFHFHDDYK